METTFERECLCRYLYSLTEENGYTVPTLAEKMQKPVEELEKILTGKISPSLDNIIDIANILGVKITVHQSYSFAHKKIVTSMERK